MSLKREAKSMKRVIICSSLFIMVAMAGSTDTLAVQPTLPEPKDVFVVAFHVTGMGKESRDIYSREEFISALPKALYIGRFIAQLKSPIEDHYWNQDGVIVLNNKRVYSFQVFEDQQSGERFLNVYFADGNGTQLFRLPQPVK